MPKKRPSWIPIVLILLLSAAFRLYGLQWEDAIRSYPHPDERHLANTMSRLSLPDPIDWELLLNDPDHSPLNPRRLIPGGEGAHFDLAYGTLPIYLYRATAVALAELLDDPSLDSYPAYAVIGRGITVISAVLTVFWIYRIGQRVFGKPTALLGATLLSICVLHIQLAHFMTVDLLMSAMLTGGLLFAVRFAQTGRYHDAIGMGLMLGLGMACKFNGITLGAGIAVAYGAAWLGRRRSLGNLLLYAVPLTLICWVAAFTLFEYYAVRDPYTYAHAIGIQADMVTGETDWPYTRQYIHTPAYLYQLENLVVWGMGCPLGIAAIAGTIAALLEAIRGAVRPHVAPPQVGERTNLAQRLYKWLSQPQQAGSLVLLGWALPYFAYTGSLEVKFLRYMLPLTPVLCVLAAHLLLQLGQALGTLWKGKRGTAGQRVLQQALPGIVLAATLLWALAYMRVYAQEHPWQAASRWLYQNAPSDASYTWEAWGDKLPVDLPALGLYRAQYDFADNDIMMHIYHDMPPQEKLNHISDALKQADYVILSTPRLAFSVARLPWRYPVEIRYYELLFTGRLGYQLALKSTALPGLGPWKVNDLHADQSFYDYDHPPVLIFEKRRDLTKLEWRELFAEQLETSPQTTRRGEVPPVALPIP